MDRIQEILARKKEINDLLKDEKRSKDVNFQELEKEVRELNEELETLKDEEGQQEGRSNFRKVNTRIDNNQELGMRSIGKNNSISDAFKPSNEERKLNSYKYLRGLATGNWEGADEERAMATGGSSGETNIVPTSIANDIIDRSRNIAQVFNAGAEVYPMDTKEVTIARVTDDPTAEWKAENAPITDSDVEFDGVKLESKTLVAKVAMSVELFEDSPNAEAIVVHTLAESLAQKLDYASLLGTGTDNEPLGLVNTVGINKQEGGVVESYAPISRAVQTIMTKNGTPNAILTSPTVVGELDRLVDNNGNPLQQPQSVQSLEMYPTNQVEDEGIAVVGDFKQLVVGMRKGMTLDVSRTGSQAMDNLQIVFRMYLRADTAVMKEQHFTVIENIEAKEEEIA